jgi:DNA primase
LLDYAQWPFGVRQPSVERPRKDDLSTRCRIEDVRKADRLVFDLDPDEGPDFEPVRMAAFHSREIVQQIGLNTFPMVTSGRGIHVMASSCPRQNGLR